MSERSGKLRSTAGRLRAVFLVISGFLGALLLFGDRVEQAVQSNLLYKLFLGIEILKPELLILVTGVVFYPFLKKTFLAVKTAATGLISDIRGNGQFVRSNWALLALSPLLPALVASFILYEAYYLTVGRYIYFNNYHRVLVTRGEQAVADGELDKAGRIFDTCIALLKSRRCTTRAEELQHRIALTASLRRLFEALPDGNFVGRIILAEDILALDRDTENHREFATHVKDRLHLARNSYIEGLKQVILENYEIAVIRLREANAIYPGFGDAHILLDETDLLLQNRGARDTAIPYLIAVRTLGPYKTAEQTLSGLPPIVGYYAGWADRPRDDYWSDY